MVERVGGDAVRAVSWCCSRHPVGLRVAAPNAVLPFALWWALLTLLQVPDMIGKSPVHVFNFVFVSDGTEAAQGKLLVALAKTLPIAALGMAAGVAFACGHAVTSHLMPGFTRAFLPVALVTQTMLLGALTPLLVLILGLGTEVNIWVTTSVTFFPAYGMITQGLSQVPRAYGATAWRKLRLLAIPASLPWVFVAIRTTVPRVLLGVMIAEWLATGRGLGNLMNQSRGYMDFSMICTVAVVSVLLSVACYQPAQRAENRFSLERGRDRKHPSPAGN